MAKGKVVVGMSGGVDSSVAALLLKEQGYDVVGVTMQIWQDEDETVKEENGGCCGLSAVDDARRVAMQLGIPYYVMNFKREFKEKVMDYFVREYLCGRTPNPCIACNRYVKWESLLQRSLEIGADYIATGHYARIEQLSNGRLAIAASATREKDQTYALYNLTQEQLKHTLMPVGEYTKEEIRQKAEANGLLVAHKKDSQEICFVPDNDYAGFVEKQAELQGLAIPPEGEFVTCDGRVLGRHKGIVHYTIGQRRGLTLPMGERVYVTAIRPDNNEVVIGSNEELFSEIVTAHQINFMGLDETELPVLSEEQQQRAKAGEMVQGVVEAVGKIRYGHRGTACRLWRSGEDELTALFTEKVRAVTRGQAAVFYVNDKVACGGVL